MKIYVYASIITIGVIVTCNGSSPDSYLNNPFFQRSAPLTSMHSTNIAPQFSPVQQSNVFSTSLPAQAPAPQAMHAANDSPDDIKVPCCSKCRCCTTACLCCIPLACLTLLKCCCCCSTSQNPSASKQIYLFASQPDHIMLAEFLIWKYDNSPLT